MFGRKMRWGLLLITGVLLLMGCQQQSPETQVRPQDLLENPEQHVGTTVVVSGEVDQIFTPRSFTIGGPDFAENVLVVSSDSLVPAEGRTAGVPTAEGDIVQVTGVVERYAPETVDQQYGVRLPPEAASEFDGEFAVIAQQASQPSHGVFISPRVPAGTRGPVTDVATATDSSEQPGLRGRVGRFSSAPIWEIIRPRLFWVGLDRGERMLVVVSPASTPNMEGENAQTPQAGEEWQLHGVFRRIPGPSILRTDWGLSDELVEEVQNQEVYLNALTARPAGGTTSPE